MPCASRLSLISRWTSFSSAGPSNLLPDRFDVGDIVGFGNTVGVGVGCRARRIVAVVIGCSRAVVPVAKSEKTPPQCSSTSERISPTVCLPSAIADSTAYSRKARSSPVYCPPQMANAFTTNSRSVGSVVVGLMAGVAACVAREVGVGKTSSVELDSPVTVSISSLDSCGSPSEVTGSISCSTIVNFHQL